MDKNVASENQDNYKTALPRFIEVEISTYCNRTCSWCPNGWNDRGIKHNSMAEATWKTIIGELGSIQYSGGFAFHNYNEPLADSSIFNKVAQARDKMSAANIMIFTNGDYLTAAKFKTLVSLGVNHFRIMLYPDKATPFIEPKKESIIQYAQRILDIRLSTSDIFLDHHLQAKFFVDSVEVHFMAPFVKHYHNRGRTVLLPELNIYSSRTTPCFLPFLSAAIDFEGNLKLCCEIYDVTEKGYDLYNIGNVLKEGFVNLWFSEKMNYLRNKVAVADFSELPACRYCRYFLDEKQLSEMTTTDPLP